MKTLSTSKVLFGVIGYSYLTSLLHQWQQGHSLTVSALIEALGGAIGIIGFAGFFYLTVSFIYLFIKDKTNRINNCTIAFIVGVFVFSIPFLLGFPK